MSEHSIGELKRQYEAAVSRANQANTEKFEAGKRYTEKAVADKLAEFAARGITPGSKVRLIVNRWDRDNTYIEAGFLGVEAGCVPGQAHAVIGKLKKDGTVSKRKWSIYFSDIESLYDPAQDSLPSQENAA